MVTRLRNQSNMIVRQEERKFVMEKMADEGTSTPFMARIFLGLLHIRETAFHTDKDRLEVDKLLNQALSPLHVARVTAQNIERLWSEHAHKIHSGEGYSFDGPSIRIEGGAYRSLRKEVESFLYDAAKAMKGSLHQTSKIVR
jgi:hypothetical protein